MVPARLEPHVGGPDGRPLTDPGARAQHPVLHFVGLSDCHVRRSGNTEAFDSSMVADLRRSAGRYPDEPQLRELVSRLQEVSEPFRYLWQRCEIAEHGSMTKVIDHPDVGRLDLDCDILTTQRGDLRVVMYSAEPGSASESKLALLATIGTQHMMGAADMMAVTDWEHR
ncbi:hypothetical protein ACGFZU_36760 [Streptomyces tendae]|uniref:MmyB family transcriptional regulator n=1 Tax=Streptomyces tendae TaxID=1932 RepID=UPI003710AFDE